MHRTLRIALALSLSLAAAGPAAARHIVVAVVDGPRASEFLNEPGRPHVPRLDSILIPAGTLLDGYRNEDMTLTIPGHSATLTGTAQPLPNDGSVPPTMPTLFERIRKDTGAPATDVWMVAGKDKLAAVAYSSHPDYGAAYGASVDATLRNDAATFAAATAVLGTWHPVFTCINFASVDLAGHAGVWADYLTAITTADSLLAELWAFIEADSVLGGDTDLFIVADHGRHDDAHGGFVNHGDGCEGCRTLPFVAVGPDLKVGATVTRPAKQEDTAATIAWLLGVGGPPMEGYVLGDILVNPPQTGVEDATALRPVFAGPNPFRASLELRFDGWSPRRLDVLDARGRLVSATPLGGLDRYRWDGRDRAGRAVAPGIYFLRLSDAAATRTVRVVRLP